MALDKIAPALIKKFGVMGTITWSARALDQASSTTTPLLIPVYVDTVTLAVAGGGKTTVTTAYMPATEQPLDGATLTVKGKKYTLRDVTVQYGPGGVACYQEAQLV